MNQGNAHNPGDNLPFNIRGYQSWNLAATANSGLTYNQDQINNPLTKYKINTGDVPWRLSTYLAALALEYKLLKNNGQDLTKVKHEIFFMFRIIKSN
ncbi:MAG: hypothetical protein JSU07_03210 [Bacteroidetes bacterium]|nr:hypothetical protein [Bacteroidota bacterium]